MKIEKEITYHVAADDGSPLGIIDTYIKKDRFRWRPFEVDISPAQMREIADFVDKLNEEK
jgi:hypothetical protein